MTFLLLRDRGGSLFTTVSTLFFSIVTKRLLPSYRFHLHLGAKRISTTKSSAFSFEEADMSGQNDASASNGEMVSDIQICQVPMDVIIRPIPPVLDEVKVQSLMNTIKVRQYY